MTERERMELMLLRDIEHKVSRKTWFSDFSSNIAGNAVWDGAVWLISRFLRRL